MPGRAGRQPAAERRRAIIEATLHALARHGAGGVSVRTIAAEAGVSPGLVTHHFEGVEPLIAAALGHASDEVRRVREAAAALAGDDPKARLIAMVQASFGLPASGPDLIGAWLAFVALAQTMPLVAAAHRESYRRATAQMEEQLAACEGRGRRPVTMPAIMALIEGLWLDLSVGSHTMTPEAAGDVAGGWLRDRLG